MYHTLDNVRIAGIRAAVPAGEIRLADEARFYAGGMKKVERLRTALGIDRRRVAPATTTASDLCAHAARSLLEAFPDMSGKIDVLIFVSQSPDWPQPATACELQHRLGLPESCAAFDVNQGCSGYVYGLWLAATILAAGGAGRILLLVGDTPSHHADECNRVTGPVFGDGGSATLLVRDEDAPPMHFDFGTDGRGFAAVIRPAGGARIPFSHVHEENAPLVEGIADPNGNIWRLTDTFMDGGAIFDFTLNIIPPHIQNMLHHAALAPEAVDCLVLHQANRQIVENIASKAGFPLEKTLSCSFGRYGNTASASIPLAMCDAFGDGRKPGTLLLCGYGIGLSWGSCLCHIDDWDCAPPVELASAAGSITRSHGMEHWLQILKKGRIAHD